MNYCAGVVYTNRELNDGMRFFVGTSRVVREGFCTGAS